MDFLTNTASAIELSDVSVSYGGIPAVERVSFRVEPGEFVAMVGPSGSGKTSVLRAIAGFEPIVSGEIRLHGELVSASKLHTAPERRRVGLVFQDYALFPHLNVAENVAFGLKSLSRGKITSRVHEVLELVELRDTATYFPHQLSGGQQQRIALARALAPAPPVMLIDEPFASLDSLTRERLGSQLRDILKAARVTALMITHDQHEASALADKIGVLSNGRLEQFDTAEMLYRNPASIWVATLFGKGFLLRGTAAHAESFATVLGEISCRHELALGTTVDLLLRPHQIEIVAESLGCPAKVTGVVFLGPHWVVALRLADGQPVSALSARARPPIEGSTAGVIVKNYDRPIFFVSTAS